MAYTNNLDTFKRRVYLLAEMLEGKDCVWTCEPGTERRLAEQIREALWIAAQNPDRVGDAAATLGKKYRIVTTRQGAVMAQKRVKGPQPSAPTAVRTMPAPGFLPERGSQSSPRPSSSPSLFGALSLTQVISLVKEGAALPLRLEETVLPKKELDVLSEWLKTHGGMLLFWTDPGVTICAPDPELEPFAYSKED